MGTQELSNGDGVDLSIDDLSSQDEDEIYLEQMFVREDGNQYYVYKKGDNGKLKKQYVEVGKNVSGSLEIVSGLSLDDEIAFPYGRDVREGAKTKSTDTLYVISKGGFLCWKISDLRFRESGTTN